MHVLIQLLFFQEKGYKREEMFITTKVNSHYFTYEKTLAAMNESFAKLGLDYLDLVLIHSPGMPPGTVFQRAVLVWQTQLKIFTQQQNLVRCEFFWFFLFSFPQKREKCTSGSVDFDQFIHFLIEVQLLFNFIIQRLKSKDTSLKKYAN